MGGHSVYEGLEGPIYVYIGRVAVEKNIEAFLDIELPGTKVVVGPGPQLEELKRRYKNVVFTGNKSGDELARHFADADVMVFPSFTDTFGLVILESMACGTPVAAFVANGPKDIIPGSNAGAIGDDLQKACLEALEMKREDCRAFAEQHSWRACAEEFVKNLKPQPRPERRRFWRRLRRLGRRG
jgi:glycosyltransferase involved in cell wall biosynthesis